MIHSAHDNDAGRIGDGGVDGGHPATIAGPASADPAVCACDPQALAVAEVRYAGGGWLDAEVNVDGAAPVHAKQTPGGYLGGATPGATVTLEPGHGAHAMVEWVAAAGGPDPTCAIYGPSGPM